MVCPSFPARFKTAAAGSCLPTDLLSMPETATGSPCLMNEETHARGSVVLETTNIPVRETWHDCLVRGEAWQGWGGLGLLKLLSY